MNTEYLHVALTAAREAGDLIRSRIGSGVRIALKGQINLVTEVDTACEALIRRRILEAFPDHRILGEEEGEKGEGSPCLWLVDPLDGTTNFAHGYPFFAVSIALEVEGRVQVGVVHDPTRNETFWATLGGGAFLDGEPIHVTDEDVLDHSLLVTGFPYDVRKHPDIHLDLFRSFMMTCRGLRRDGAAALDLCYLACGRFDGFYELGLAPWDMAAGSLIVTEAGGVLTDFRGTPLNLRQRELVGSNGRIHPAMLEVIRPHLEALRSTPYYAGEKD